ncbi:Sugar kinase of the NBD/HSP70 family, may contain an N-terminal HTH domain [Atopostipes suicloacalis DSM 15692]|uniref:Sugar kinase of the NBD/HSP70 family, may contain an N-terminal HTH domain n=1 Tax=Atopostipes suicloacalis DSM 15692 TaxID=1121025 RepID=A0A1M4S4I4_9LACT|nr:ROK family transcriptional regulator [Atopostipes suicloacalis]SHE27111.1 Sugar kinase of the NBD/HSP70 family, may contain an N-terminal HTH domain [Atopostipes suicloacalis DSM 15692]
MLRNFSSMREQNTHAILSQIINHPEISRAEISKQTNLNKASVSEIVRNLIDEQYVVETGIGKSSTAGGRKPILLKINKKAGFSFSFDVRYDRLSYMVTYLNGEVLTFESVDMNIDQSNIVSVVENIIRNFQQSMENSPFGIIGIAIAIHGVVSKNKIIFTPYYDLSQIDLANELEKRLHLPIYLENEANLTALAEASMDATHKNLISVSIHTGVGAGIIIEEKLYHGFEGRSGEIGHTTLYPDGIACPCGNKGCLEQYCSQSSVLNAYRNAMENELLTVDNLIMDYKNGENIAVKIIEDFAKNLSIGMTNLMGTYGPEIIYINNKIIKDIPSIIVKIREHLDQTMYKKIPVEISQVAQQASLYGATAMNIQNFLGVKTFNFFN